MLKVTATASNGLKTEKPFEVFLTLKSSYRVEENKLTISFSQSLDKEKEGNSSIDYLGLKRQVVIIENFTPIADAKKFITACEAEVVKAISDSKLDHITEIKSV